MTDDAYWEDLGQRAVACDGWRWMPGMRAVHPYTSPIRVTCGSDGEDCEDLIVRPGPDGNELHRPHEWAVLGSFPGGLATPFLPDLRDPATLGCLLTLVREKHGPVAHTEPCGGGWEFYVDEDEWSGVFASTESEALVAALEASA